MSHARIEPESAPSVPHGGRLIDLFVGDDEHDAALEAARGLDTLTVSPAVQSDLELLSTGAFSPLTGFLTRRDLDSVVRRCRLDDDTVWPLPIALPVDHDVAARVREGSEIALTDGSQALAVLRVEDVFEYDTRLYAREVFRTESEDHPGVARLHEQGSVFLGGTIRTLRRPSTTEFAGYHLDPIQTRRAFVDHGWRSVVAFQTRNPIHRAHEFIQKSALEIVDGLLVHPLVGETKSDDIPADIRMRCYEALLQAYYPADRVLLSVFPAVMRYAGPREAIFHALVRKNYGCTHFIVGRDHAGVGSFYGTYDAQRIFDQFRPQEIGIVPLPFEHTFFCRACEGMASLKTCPHSNEQRVILSGTRIREMLRNGEAPPAEFTRPEVARILVSSMSQRSPARPAAGEQPPARGEPWEPELRAMEEQIELFVRGETPEEKFKEYRLANGIYGQKQDGVQMIRVKIPNGVLSPDQLDALAEVSENHGHGVAHLTTRQDVQYHHVPLGEVPAVLRILARAGLHTREACGNSVRNVTSCPFSGVCRDEPFPVLPYAQATARFLLRHSAAQILGRKFKIAFSGCASDCAKGAIHDIGAIATVRTLDGVPRPGFRILVGGGLGAVPYLAETLTEFVSAQDILQVCETIVRVFSAHGNRRSRARARLKFIVQRGGIEAFRRRFDEAWTAVSREDRDDLDVESYLFPEEIASLAAEAGNGNGDGSRDTRSGSLQRFNGGGFPNASLGVPAEDSRAPTDEHGSVRDEGAPTTHAAPGVLPGYATWLARNTRAQRQRSLRSVTVNFALGDMRPPDVRALATVMRELGSSEARITVEQNLVLQNIPETRLPELYARLDERELAASSGESALDVLSCPGADTCNLGITTSKGLAEAIANELRESDLDPAILRDSSIKISGCPNACGQHYIGSLGFHGVARRVAGRQAPFYQLHLGGGIGSDGAYLGSPEWKVPARHAPVAARRLFEAYRDHGAKSETFAQFLRRAEKSQVEAWLAGLFEIPGPDATPEHYVDFHEDAPFTTANLGVGECAGAGVDASDDLFAEPAERIRMSRNLLQHQQWADVLAELRRAVHAVARIALERVKKKPLSDFETACEFRARFVDRGHVSERWERLLGELERLASRRQTNPEALPALLESTNAFLEEGRALVAALDTASGSEGALPPGIAAHRGEPMS